MGNIILPKLAGSPIDIQGEERLPERHGPDHSFYPLLSHYF
jgi:hypothetical protein